MNKLILGLVLVAGLSGCSDNIQGYRINQAESLCKESNSKVSEINVGTFTGDNYVHCDNGTIIKGNAFLKHVAKDGEE